MDEVLNVVSDSGKQWYQADALGSVYGLTNSSGALIGHQNYDVFGAPMPAPSGPAGQPFGFTGREHELDSGLVYARARYLNPAVGRWTAADPYRRARGTNRYLYVLDWVTRGRDPLGYDIEIIVWDPIASPDHLSSAVGHASVRVNDVSFSWEFGGLSGATGVMRWDDYLRRQSYRNGTGYVFKTTPDQDEKARHYMLAASATYREQSLVLIDVYNLITRNCTQTAQGAGVAAGVINPQHVIAPWSLHRYLAPPVSSYVNHYQGSEVPMTLVKWIDLFTADAFSEAYWRLERAIMLGSW
jgi:RHS repeat-associated protein